jgi:hypothetical protein
MEFGAFFRDLTKNDKFFDKFFDKKEFYGWKGLPAPQRAARLARGEEFYPRKILRKFGNTGNLWYVYRIKIKICH